MKDFFYISKDTILHNLIANIPEKRNPQPELSSLTNIETDGQKLSVFLKNLSLICWKISEDYY